MFFSDRMPPSPLGAHAPLSPSRQGERLLHEQMCADLDRLRRMQAEGQRNREGRPYRILGLDLGQANDPSSAVLVERDLNWELPAEAYITECIYGARAYKRDECKRLLGLNDVKAADEARRLAALSDVKVARHLARREQRQLPLHDFPLAVRDVREWPLGTDYYDVVEDALNMTPDLLVPDFCGVGRPIWNMLRRRAGEVNFRGRLVPVQTVTSAMSRSRSKLERGLKGSRTLFHQVPKRELVSVLEAVEQSGRLFLPERDTMVDKMIRQLEKYQVKFTNSSRPTMTAGAASGSHDDLVSSLQLAVWSALTFGRRKFAYALSAEG